MAVAAPALRTGQDIAIAVISKRFLVIGHRRCRRAYFIHTVIFQPVQLVIPVGIIMPWISERFYIDAHSRDVAIVQSAKCGKPRR